MQNKINRLTRRVTFYIKNKKKIKLLVVRSINWIFYKKLSAVSLVKRIVRKSTDLVFSEAVSKKVILTLYKSRKKYYRSHTGARWFLKKELTVESLFLKLNEERVNYVILRWFEELPNVVDGEDIDVLVSDRDLDLLRSFCEPYDNGGQKLDIYSVSGVSGSDYEGATYYPARLSNKILDSRRLYKELFYVPSDEMYFISLAYHAVFHKGEESGLPYTKNLSPEYVSDHDYQSILRRMSIKLGIKIADYSFNGYYNLLENEGYIPELDTRRLLSRTNKWLKDLQNERVVHNEKERGELVVFIVREWAVKNNKVDFIKESLQLSGFDILFSQYLNPEASIRTKKSVRGGQWDKGPYPVSGGDPAFVIVCFDYAPVKPLDDQKAIYPHLSNKNILVKHKIRDLINRDLLFFKHVNCIHSSDDETESWDYLHIAVPEHIKEIMTQIDDIRNSGYFHDQKIKHVFVRNGTRAKTELIEHDGKLCVLKTYKPGRERYLEKEAFAYQTFSSKIGTVPPLVKRGGNYIITSYYENVLNNKTEDEKKRIIRKYTKEILDTMKLFYEHGYAILGFYPGNLIVTPDNRLVVIDYEFLHKYEVVPKSFAVSYDVLGVPDGFCGDMPRGDSNHTIKNTWKDYLDMSIVKRYLRDS
ncbi:MAG: hypothetical protein OQL28_01285 [Sedimenticola sp.]|nr:hypothetical protein [Sedimenticola sp.]